MIKYLGSKRALIPHILRLVEAACPRHGTVLDLFSGTSRVGHALKRAGHRVIACDHNAYAHALGACYVQADAEEVLPAAASLVENLNSVAGAAAPARHWFTDAYCDRSRFFHPANGPRIVAARDAIERLDVSPDLRAVLLVSLMEAADRVDSTTGVQMAYLKAWAPRALNSLTLRVPAVLPRAAGGRSEAVCADALDAARAFDADVAYIDPPYNQHSYLGNYHLWETLVRWDDPPTYGRACKRADVRERRSRFNSRRTCLDALAELLDAVRAPVIILSFSDEGYVTRDQVEALLARRGPVRLFPIDYPRYVGARIGIYNPRGERVGTPGRLRNTEYLALVGDATADLEPALTGSAAATPLPPTP